MKRLWGLCWMVWRYGVRQTLRYERARMALDRYLGRSFRLSEDGPRFRRALWTVHDGGRSGRFGSRAAGLHDLAEVERRRIEEFLIGVPADLGEAIESEDQEPLPVDLRERLVDASLAAYKRPGDHE